MTTFQPSLVATVLESALGNVPGRQICRVNSITPDALREILTAHGWPNRKATQWRLEVLLQDIEAGAAVDAAYATTAPADLVPAPTIGGGAGAPSEPAAPPARVALVERETPAPPSLPATVGVCGHLALIAEAAKSIHARTRTQGQKVEQLLTELADRVATEKAARAEKDRQHREAVKARERAKADRDAVRAAARAKDEAAKAEAALERLVDDEARIAKAKAAVQAKIDAANQAAKAAADVDQSHITPSDGLSAAQLRVWASKNGVDCPDFGRIPNRVRDAYDTAHAKAPAA